MPDVTETPQSAIPLAPFQENLQELRRNLAAWLAIPFIVGGALAGGMTIPIQAFPNSRFMLSFAALGLGLLAYACQLRWPRLAAHILVWGGGALFALALWHLQEPWLVYLAIPLALTGAALVAWSDLIVAVFCVGLAAWLVSAGYRAYEIGPFAGALIAAISVNRLASHALRAALRASWETEQRAGELLTEARVRQGALSSVLKSLELTTRALEQANQHLAVSRQQAEEAQQMKEQFAANISHELRTPLNLILGFSEMMYLSPEVYGNMDWPPTLRRDIYQIYRSSRHLLEMIDDVLDLSRFELAGFTLNKEPTDLGQLLESAAAIASGLFRARPVTLEVSIEPGLPLLDIDRTRIRQVVLNLLTNARHHTEQGSVRLEAKRSGGEVIVSVSDTGSGIPEDKLARVFEEFYRVDESLRRPTGGAGLGLAISRRFVEAHEGRIWAESRVGAGSTFYFSLPVPVDGIRTLYPKHTPPLRHPSSGPPRVVLIDPDPAVADLIQRYVAGCEVIRVDNVDAVIEQAAAPGVLAVIQNQRPGRTWPDGRPESLALPGRIPVIRCSLPSASWLAGDLAVRAVLHKPITQAQLLAHIDQAGPVSDILIVDDDRGFCQLVERLLAATGRPFVTRHAYDGEDGLAAMRDHLPDLVLLDLAMPGLNGFGLLEQMRKEEALAGVPVILLTVTSYADDLLKHSESAFSVARQGGLRLAEMLACVQGVVGALQHGPALDPFHATSRKSEDTHLPQ